MSGFALIVNRPPSAIASLVHLYFYWCMEQPSDRCRTSETM